MNSARLAAGTDGCMTRIAGEVATKGIEAKLVLQAMSNAKNRLNVVILDACRNNPFAQNASRALVPTGGVNLNTAADFIRAGAAALGVGGELILPAALNSGDTAQITELAKKYLAIVQQTREEAKPALAAV